MGTCLLSGLSEPSGGISEHLRGQTDQLGFRQFPHGLSGITQPCRGHRAPLAGLHPRYLRFSQSTPAHFVILTTESMTPTPEIPEPHYIGHRQRLKKKFFKCGLQALHDYEAVELLLSYAIPRKDIKSLSKDLLERFGSLKGIMDAELEELTAVRGISAHAAGLVRMVKEMSALYLQEKAREKPQISCTGELLDFCKTALGGLKDENFCVLYLDTQNRIIAFETIQKGIVNQAVVYPRQVIERALSHKSSALILVHNHPSGFVKPSDADIRLTRTITDTAKLLDIMVHDHLIIGENRFFSFREEGIMPL
ncbi:DNA repair protein [Syntrophus aciditrophicus SB]|uniref:DNA repair protein n=2 Tax=Syntrophus TaxID=43773 RepID=Q2LSS5_SYNAS|nr:DNA repair protein [Syntrophus aciditrophicus SB]